MIENNYFLLNVLLLTLGTVTIRGCFIAFSGKMKISHKVKDLFTYIPAAILPAIFVPATFFHQGIVEWMNGKERFIVLLISLTATYFVKNTLFCIVLGLTLLYAVQ